MKYMVDIDGTICITKDKDYKNAIPIVDRIKFFNDMLDKGHEVHYWTGRGSLSGVDYLSMTVLQLSRWGVNYTSVNVGKPDYDFWIDDKAMNSESFFDESGNWI